MPVTGEERRFRIDDLNELKTLHRALMRLKFEGQADEFFGSPYIAAVQHRVADALELAEPKRGWSEWRNASAHQHEVEIVRHHLAGLTNWWPSAAKSERAQYVRDLLARLLPSPDLLAELVNTDTSGERS